MNQRILLMLVLMILVSACGGGIPTQEATQTQVMIQTQTLQPTTTGTSTSSPTREPILLPAEIQTWTAGHPDFDWQVQVDASVPGLFPEQLIDRMKIGQGDVLQIYNETGTMIDYAWDIENYVWIERSDVIQTDVSKPENYIKIQHIDDIETLVLLEKMFLLPFSDITYFPPLDKIYRNYLDSADVDSSAEFSRIFPFGKLPKDMESPFRIVNRIVLEKNASEGRDVDSYIFTLQVYNPDDKSFSVFHIGGYKDNDLSTPGTGLESFISEAQLIIDGNDNLFLPGYRYSEKGLISAEMFHIWNYLSKEVSVLDSDGNCIIIKPLIDEWFNIGHVPEELEKLILQGLTRRFS